MSYRPYFYLIIHLIFITMYRAEAQVPRTISFQGVLADAQGNLVPDGNHQLTLKLYDVATSGNSLYTETQTVPVVKGIFNVIIGSVTSLPPSLIFDRAYFLGVSVDGGNELTPRTALTAVPYSLRAERANIAESLSPNASGVVTNVNGQSGALTLQGAGGTTITNAGAAFTISSTGSGGTGIQGVQNIDGTISIQNPNGPVATIGVANNGINASKLSDGAVTSAKIASGQVVTSVNNLKDAVTLNAGSNISIAPSGNALMISSTGGSGVPSVNSITGPVTLAASGGATVNTNGNTITINAGAGGEGTGIQGVQNTNNTLDILNSGGLTATINVKDQGITTTQLADNAVTSAKIVDGQVQTNDLANASVTQAKLAAGLTLPPSGTAGGDLTGTYPNPTVASNAITTSKLADNSVTSAKIGDGQISTADIADNAITTAKIANDAVTTVKIVNSAVTTQKIADDAITTAKIGNDAVTAAKIQPDVVSSIDGVSNDGGNIDLVAGANITITPDNAANTITITARNDSLKLPYTAQVNSTYDAIQLRNWGGGGAGYFYVNTTGSSLYALNATTESSDANSRAVSAKAEAGSALDAFSRGTQATISAINLNASLTAPIYQGYAGSKVFEVNRNGDIDASGDVSADTYTAATNLGSTGTPNAGGMYRDNVVYAWANVGSTGSLVAGFGCTVSKTAVGTYSIVYNRSMTGSNYAPMAVALEATAPQFAVISSVTSTGCSVKIWKFSAGNFVLTDSQFFFHLTGRP